MPPKIEGGSANDRDEIRRALDGVRRHLTTQITDAELQSCINAETQDDEVTIVAGGDLCYSSPGSLYGYSTWTYIGPFVIHKSKTIHLCLGNIGRAGISIASVLMHELAHICCWPDGGGMGVPEGREDFRFP